MNFRPLSQGTRITLVTSPGHHPLLSFLGKCNHDVGKKCRPGQNLHSLEGVAVSRRNQSPRIALVCSPCMSRRFIK